MPQVYGYVSLSVKGCRPILKYRYISFLCLSKVSSKLFVSRIKKINEFNLIIMIDQNVVPFDLRY